MNVLTIAFAIVALIIGFVIGYVMSKNNIENRLKDSNKTASMIIENANKEAETMKKETLLEAREQIQDYRTQVENELQQRRSEVSRQENRVEQREDNLDFKDEQLSLREVNLSEKEEKLVQKGIELDEREQKLDELFQQQEDKLQEIAEMTRDEAHQQILQTAEREMEHEIAVLIKKSEEEAKRQSEKIAKDIITQSITRSAADEVAESTVSVIHLPNDDMKGRIIGKEGRNIRTIESLTGMDVIIDDTPETVVLSGFDPIRREIAKLTLEKLIKDGRIHPGRIEEAVEKSRKEMEKRIREIGEETVFELGIHNLHPDLIKIVGRLNYRTSYGQNALIHSKEVAKISGILASEIGEDAHMAKRAGLLHDIGKAIDGEVEGSHVEIGVELAMKYNEPKEVVDAIASHHGDAPANSTIAVLVEAADQISAARPGARSESLESYLQRLSDLEEISNDFDGVKESYAIQAGREVRVIVKPDEVQDADAIKLAHDIRKRIESDMEYPGHIKVTVIRETRVTETAK